MTSAQWTEPATDFPPTEIENARAVLARSIDCVKRTESTASRAILVLFATGRKRTTDGAVVVWTLTAACSSGRPSVSRTPETTSR